MPSIEHRMVFGAAAPVGADLNPLTNIRPKVPPAGRVLSLLNRLTPGAHSAYQIGRTSKTYYDLLDAGLLGAADVITLPLGTEADSLLNWAGTGSIINEGGAPWTKAKGFNLTGTGPRLDTGIIPSASTKYQLNSASIGANVSDPAALASNASIIGGATGSPVCSLVPLTSLNSAPASSIRLNSGTGLATNYAGSRSGLFMGNRTGANDLRLVKDGALLASTAANAATAVPTGKIVVGGTGGADANFWCDAVFVGASLTPAQEAALAQIVAEHCAAAHAWA